MPNILIVGNQPCVRELLSHELSSEGYEVATAANKELAWRHLSSSRPDVVLLDLCLDRLDEYDLLLDIKAQHPDLPVIIVTSHDCHLNDPRLSQADGYVVKSFDFTDLKIKVAGLLGRKVRPQGSVQANPYFRKLRFAHHPP